LLNAYEDDGVRAAIEASGRRTALVAGLLTEACVSFPAISLSGAGYTSYIVADSCGGFSTETHQLALSRAAAAGVGLTSWIQLLLEWQKDWTNTITYAGAVGILADFGGAYGLELQHARDMLTSPAATPPA
jgi:isochorismate hydrolase